MPMLMSLCRVLGIIYVCITNPYFEEAMSPNITAIKMGPVYTKLINKLQKWIKDVDP